MAGVVLLATGAAAESVRPPTASRKRGVCYNRLTLADLTELRPGVSWMYNWHFDTEAALRAPSAGIAYYPMVWGAAKGSLEGFEQLAAGGFVPEYVLALNEPNLKGQAFLTPEDAAKYFLAIRRVADKYQIRTVGPHMALGSHRGSSITAFDPIEGKDTTYTYMVPYLKAFLHFVGDTNKVDAIAVHSYGNIGELRWMVGMLAETCQKPVWVTEFNWWGARDERQALEYLVEAVDLLERSPHVEKYAWFKADMGDGKNSLLSSSGQLTALGKAYVRMPAIEPDAWHPVPGRLEGEACVRLKGTRVTLGGEEDGFLDVLLQKADGWLEFQVDVAAAATRTLSVRISDADAIGISVDGGPAASVPAPTPSASPYQTAHVPLALSGGHHTLRITAAKPGTRVNWISWQ
jgi:hypothetical protein